MDARSPTAGRPHPRQHPRPRAAGEVHDAGPSHPAAPTPALPRGGYLFLTVGSGITPAMSMVRALADHGSDANVAFVHSARSPGDIIFHRELAALAEAGLDVRVTIVCEVDRPGERWDGPLGRLGPDLLRAVAPGAAEREVFLCGPFGYLGATTAILERLGADPGRVHRETSPSATPPRSSPTGRRTRRRLRDSASSSA